MTKTQVSYKEHKERERANKAQEAENFRSNSAKEKENYRHNKKQEGIDAQRNAIEKNKTISSFISSLFGSAIRATNDPGWYNRVGPLTKDTANLPFGRALYRPYSGTTMATRPSTLLTPGILTIPCGLTIGNPNDKFAAMNVAGTKGYTFVRSVNSGSAEGLPPDFIKYVMAVRSIIAMIAEAQKAYAASRTYSSENRYIGQAIIEALGFTASSVYSNQAQFRSALNRVIVKLGVIAIPKEFPLFARTAWMFGNVFKDSDSDKAQLVQYRLDGYHLYHDDLGYLEWCRKGTNTSIMSWIAHIEQCVDALLDSEFVWIQSGDILKAFGDSSLLKLPYMQEDLTLDLVYSEEVLSQIHNLRCATSAYFELGPTDDITDINQIPFGTFDIYELDGKVTQGVQIRYMDADTYEGKLLFDAVEVAEGKSSSSGGSYSVVQLGTVLDMYTKGQPTPDDVMVATRMTAILNKFIFSDTVYPVLDGDNNIPESMRDESDAVSTIASSPSEGDTFVEVVSCGSELATDLIITAFELTQYGIIDAVKTSLPQVCMQVHGGTSPKLAKGLDLCLKFFRLLSAWHYAPALEYFMEVSAADKLIPYYQWEINNSVSVDTEVMNAMHDAALYSEFNLGDLGGFKSAR